MDLFYEIDRVRSGTHSINEGQACDDISVVLVG